MYHRFLRHRPRSDIHPVIGRRTCSVHRPRSLVIVDPGDVLRRRESIPSTNAEAGKKGAYSTVFCEPRLVLEAVHGVATGVELVTIRICDWYRRQHSNVQPNRRLLLGRLTGCGNRRNGLLENAKMMMQTIQPHFLNSRCGKLKTHPPIYGFSSVTVGSAIIKFWVVLNHS